MVFQLQFTLFQAAQLQLVIVAVLGQFVYDRVQVAMFHVEFDEAALDILYVSHYRFPNLVSVLLTDAVRRATIWIQKFREDNRYILPLRVFPVHSLIYDDVAANTDRPRAAIAAMTQQRKAKTR